MSELIELINEEGNIEEYYIVEETRLNGVSYILIAESLSDEAQAYILKDISDEESDEAEYIFVEDEDELDAVAAIFSELLEDIELE